MRVETHCKTLYWPYRTNARTPRTRTPDSARTPRGSESAALATQNRSAHCAVWDSGLRADSARLRKCCPGHTEQKRTLRSLGLRTPRGLRECWPGPIGWKRGLRGLGLRPPRGLREAPKVLAWPHRTEARTPRGLGLRTLREDSARLGTSSVVVVVVMATSFYITRTFVSLLQGPACPHF